MPERILLQPIDQVVVIGGSHNIHIPVLVEIHAEQVGGAIEQTEGMVSEILAAVVLPPGDFVAAPGGADKVDISVAVEVAGPATHAVVPEILDPVLHETKVAVVFIPA